MNRIFPWIAWLVLTGAFVATESLAATAGARADLTWCVEADYGKLHVVVAENAAPEEAHAAEVFQKYWKLTTGKDIPIVHQQQGAFPVWIGWSALPDSRRVEIEHRIAPQGLEHHGIAYCTLGWKEPVELVIAGGSPVATEYAVFDFFERVMGVRWLAPGVVHIPEKAPAKISKIEVFYNPPFLYRSSTYYSMIGGDDDYRLAHKLSEEPGYGLFVHSSYTLLPPEKYFKDHPEYYSLVDGKRVAPIGYNWDVPEERAKHPNTVGQLCMSNPATAEAIAAELKPMMRKSPNLKIWSVSQMDWFSNCECAQCKAIDEAEGSSMGAFLTGVNCVADAIRDEFPDRYIETIAYQFTRKPPKTIVPRDNVIIRLCSIECDFATPLGDPSARVNAEFADDIKGWSAIAKHLYIWDYTPDYYNYHVPHPNFQVLQPNLRFFREHKVGGVFEQGSDVPGAEFAHLRKYLVAELMWNPEANTDELKNDFIDGYYAETGPFIKQYIDLITRKVVGNHVYVGCFDQGLWLDYDTVVTAQRIFAKAYTAVRSDEIRKRLDDAYLPVQWAALVCLPKVEIAGSRLVGRRPPSISLEEYLKKCDAEGFKDKDAYEATMNRTGGKTPPRLVMATIERIENERYEVWVTPELSGAIVRWRDKKLKTEALRGYEHFWGFPGKIEDWVNTPMKAEAPVAQEYRVVDRGQGTLTVEGKTEGGLVVRRKMSLDGDNLGISLTVTNPTNAPLPAKVKIHPEFYAQGSGAPEIWAKAGQAWNRADANLPRHQNAYGKYLEPGNLTALAFYAPEKNVSVVSEFDPAKIGGLLFFFNTENAAQQVNLEIIPNGDPLKPGESRTLEGRYSVRTGRPNE